MDLRYDNQIIVNPDAARTAKQSPLNPGMAKAAAAAGVKPVSLLTRVGPNERPVPKPAFELTAKKLDAKTAAASPKKIGTKAKANKSTTFQANTSVGEKKAASAEKTGAGKGEKQRAAPVAGHRANERKKIPAHATAKPASHPGGQKPSPAIAKSQPGAEPSD